MFKVSLFVLLMTVAANMPAGGSLIGLAMSQDGESPVMSKEGKSLSDAEVR